MIVCFCLLLFVGIIMCISCGKENEEDSFCEEQYNAAVRDAIFAETDEIQQLVTIDENSDMVIWNDNKDKVLMVSWHSEADDYPASGMFVNEKSEIWVFTTCEMIAWYKNHASDVTDWKQRFTQLLGLPIKNECSRFTAFWVNVKDLIRPAYQPDIRKQVSEGDLNGSSLVSHKTWFDQTIVGAYFGDYYPWTRLGYTYDWADNGTEYGLSEFIILKNSSLEVAFSMTTDEFVKWLASETL